MIIIKKSYHREKAYNDGTTAYNDGTKSYNNKPAAYNDGTTAYSDKPTAYSDKPTAYNNKSAAYNDGTTTYNDKPTTHYKYYHIRQLWRSIKNPASIDKGLTASNFQLYKYSVSGIDFAHLYRGSFISFINYVLIDVFKYQKICLNT